MPRLKCRFVKLIPSDSAGSTLVFSKDLEGMGCGGIGDDAEKFEMPLGNPTEIHPWIMNDHEKKMDAKVGRLLSVSSFASTSELGIVWGNRSCFGNGTMGVV